MSRRHTPNRDHRKPLRTLGTTLVLLISLGAALPAGVWAQDASISEQAIDQQWQLLTYRDANMETQTVPAGVGAIVHLYLNDAFGEAACSSFEGNYQRPGGESLYIDPGAIDRFSCDPASQAFDEVFYQDLTETAAVRVSDSIMTLFNSTLEPLMTLTRATIDADPTVARWDLARLGAADGSIEPVLQGLGPWVDFTTGGRVVGDTGCGMFLGSYEISDGTMRISDVASRLEGCTESALRQAEQMVATLDDISDFEVLPAGMALRDADGTLRLAFTPEIDLAAITWTPIEILDAQGEVLYDETRLNTSGVKFFGGKAEGRSICGAFSGRSLSSGLALSTTGDLKRSGRCSKKSQPVEDAFIAALERTSSQALRGSELELKDVDGMTLMRLLPQEELVGPTWVVTALNSTPGKTKVKKVAPLPDTQLTASFEDVAVSVLGDTGAVDRSGTSNFFIAAYRTPAAMSIDIYDISVEGRACASSKRASSPVCQQEGLYESLLDLADGYIVRAGELRLVQGSRGLIWFAPQAEEALTP